MKRLSLGIAALAAAVCFAPQAFAQADAPRAELMQLYLASIAADRCEFELSEADADSIIQTATGLQKQLKISDEAADALYEEVEAAFEAKLPAACNKDGEIAKSYAQVIDRVRRK